MELVTPKKAMPLAAIVAVAVAMLASRGMLVAVDVAQQLRLVYAGVILIDSSHSNQPLIT